MSDHQRLANLEELLKLLYEKLGYFERQLIIAHDPSTKFDLEALRYLLWFDRGA